MSQRPEDNNPFDPFGAWKSMRDTNIEAWSKMMQQIVNSEAYAQSTGALLDAYLTTSAPFRKLIEQTMTQVLEQVNMPTRADVTRLAERLTNIEMRLDDMEAAVRTVQESTHAMLHAITDQPLAEAPTPEQEAAIEEAEAEVQNTADEALEHGTRPRSRRNRPSKEQA